MMKGCFTNPTEGQAMTHHAECLAGCGDLTGPATLDAARRAAARHEREWPHCATTRTTQDAAEERG